MYPEPLQSEAMKMFEEMNATPELTRLMTGRCEYFAMNIYLRVFSLGGLLGKIINDTTFCISEGSSQKTKMYLYSAHDITVAGFLINLGVYTPHLPPYGCYILLEVHKITNTYGIKVRVTLIF